MRAAVLVAVGKIKVDDIREPKCPDDGIIIRVKACTICGTDLKLYRYGYEGLKPPLILGHELSGVIEEVGQRVRGYVPGERVALAPNIPCGTCFYCQKELYHLCENLLTFGINLDGGFAEYMLVPYKAIVHGCVNKLPDLVTFQEAALAEPLACVVNAQEITPVNIEDAVLIIGAGPAGLMHAQLAKAQGARVILAQRSEARLNLARSFGLDTLISTQEEDLVLRVQEETSGKGVDLVIVACASPEIQELTPKLVCKRGRINFFGGLPRERPRINFESNLVHYGEIVVTGTHGCSARHHRIAIDLIERGAVSTEKLISGSFELPQFAEALEFASSGKGLKTVVLPWT